ncbi:MAG TPA: hypothetical protein VFR67_27755 [Pilimelia sp.]|nr:hypothetical protein [Pilimelia sp.]
MPRTSSVLPTPLARLPHSSPAALSRRCGGVLAGMLLVVGLAAVPSSPRQAYAAPTR